MLERRIQLAAVDILATLPGAGEAFARRLGEALREEGLVAPDDEVRSVVGLPMHRAVAAVTRTVRSLEDEARTRERVLARFEASFRRHFEGLTQPEPDVVTRTFSSLRAQGCRIVIVSVLPRDVVDVMLRSARWFERGLVDTIVAESEASIPRPQPGLVFEAMARTQVMSAARVMKIGETPADLAEGTQARCGAVIGVTSGVHTRSDLLRWPHTHLVDRLSEALDVLALSAGGLRLLGRPCDGTHERPRSAANANPDSSRYPTKGT